MRLRQAAADRDELAAAQLASERAPADSLAVQVAALAAQVEELQRLLGKNLGRPCPRPRTARIRRSRRTGRCAAGPGASPASSPARSRAR